MRPRTVSLLPTEASLPPPVPSDPGPLRQVAFHLTQAESSPCRLAEADTRHPDTMARHWVRLALRRATAGMGATDAR